MRLTIWGARGSIPISGPEFNRYGGETTSLEFEASNGQILCLDAGSGVRGLSNKVFESGAKEHHLLITHPHMDHVLGLPFFRPLFDPDSVIHIYGATQTERDPKKLFLPIASPPVFPIPVLDVPPNVVFHDIPAGKYTIAGLECETFWMNHPGGGVAIKIHDEGKQFVFMPDNEIGFEHPDGPPYADLVEFVRGVDLLVHDSEYHRSEYEAFSKGWGHSVIDDSVKLAMEADVKQLWLWHLNQTRTDEQVEEIKVHAQKLASDAGSNLICDIVPVRETREI